MPHFPSFRPFLAVLFLASLAVFPNQAAAARLSAKDQAAIQAIQQRMAAAQQQYRAASQADVGEDAAETGEAGANAAAADAADAALGEMEAALDACALQRGCEVSPLLAVYKQALKEQVGGEAEDGFDDENGEEAPDDDPLDDGSDHSLLPSMPESARAATLLNDQRHDFDRMVQFNPAVQAGIRRWLTDMRPALIDSYENYRNMRADLYPPWQRDGLPEALLFGILAKESNGKVHATSRAGAGGPLQFMPSTGRRFGLGPDGTGFDTRYDPRSAGYASAEYIKERMAELNGSVEFALAAYNGGEGRALRVFQQYPGRSFWDDAVHYQFPVETRDYVPMVIAAAWLFLHPRQYGLKFPRVSPRPATLQLVNATSINELTMCLGNGGTRDGFQRTLRNLNPRYQPDAFIPAGTTLKANTRIASLYRRYCDKGPRAELARTLSNASVGAAIVRTSLPVGSVAVGDVTSLRDPAAAAPPKPRPAPVKRYTVKRGDTLGRIAERNGCGLQALARANGLRAPGYVVKPGQSLKLEGCRK